MIKPPSWFGYEATSSFILTCHCGAPLQPLQLGNACWGSWYLLTLLICRRTSWWCSRCKLNLCLGINKSDIFYIRRTLMTTCLRCCEDAHRDSQEERRWRLRHSRPAALALRSGRFAEWFTFVRPHHPHTCECVFIFFVLTLIYGFQIRVAVWLHTVYFPSIEEYGLHNQFGILFFLT